MKGVRPQRSYNTSALPPAPACGECDAFKPPLSLIRVCVTAFDVRFIDELYHSIMCLHVQSSYCYWLHSVLPSLA